MVAKSLWIERALPVVDVIPPISTCSGHEGTKIYIAILSRTRVVVTPCYGVSQIKFQASF